MIAQRLLNFSKRICGITALQFQINMTIEVGGTTRDYERLITLR